MADIQLICALIVLCVSCWIHRLPAEDAFETLLAFSRGMVQPISRKDRKLVQFWTDAGRVDDDETSRRCTVDYIRQLQDRIEADMRDTHLSDVIELYYYAELDLLCSCGDKVANLAEELIPLLKQDDNLEMTAKALNKWLHEMGKREETFPIVAEWMMWTVGADKCLSEMDFIRAWHKGPCSNVLSKMAQPHMEPLMNFVSMLDDTQIDPMSLLSNVSPSPLALVQCCEYFRTEGALINAWNALQSSDTYQTMYCYTTLDLISSEDDPMDGDYSDMDLDSP